MSKGILNFRSSNDGVMSLDIYEVVGSKDSFKNFVLSRYTTLEAAEEDAKFWKSTMEYENVFVDSHLVFIK